MNVHTDLPQVTALRLAVERRPGRSMACRSDFTILASEVDECHPGAYGGEYVSADMEMI